MTEGALGDNPSPTNLWYCPGAMEATMCAGSEPECTASVVTKLLVKITERQIFVSDCAFTVSASTNLISEGHDACVFPRGRPE